MKLSDYIAEFVASLGVEIVFAVSGGASLHLIHSIAENSKINFVATHHEQAAAMAADSYSRTSGNIGVAVTTSGPGATNLITGICCSYYDSVPVLLLTGQASTFRLSGDTGVRQIGFQETPIVDVCKSITKYSYQIKDAQEIKYQLEKAVFIAKSGRPGPVLLDIPDNLQRAQIEPSELIGYSFTEEDTPKRRFSSFAEVEKDVTELVKMSKRPVIVAGWGVHLSKTEKEFVEFVEKANIPVALTWGASDLLPSDHRLYIGTFGTHGMRHANFAVQNADLVFTFGTRLDTKATGSPINTFSREAKTVVIDIDPNELEKFSRFGLKIDYLIQENLVDVFKYLQEKNAISTQGITDWLLQINKWKVNLQGYDKQEVNDNKIDPQYFFHTLAGVLPASVRVFIDTGCSIAWSMQYMGFSKNQRVFHDFNNTAMGWSLPAVVGGFFADKTKPIVCIVGDGSFMMSMYELATIKKHRIPAKIFLINNNGYSMIKQTQEQWLSSNYFASSSGDLLFPDFEALANSFGIKYVEINSNEKTKDLLQDVLMGETPVLCNVIVSEQARVVPQVKFGRPNEDMDPLLPRDVFKENMLIKPMDSSV